MPLLWVIFLFSPSAEAQKIRFASDPYPPFIYEERGVPKGTSLPLLAKMLGVKESDLDVKIIPWKRALKEAEDGSVDIIGPMQVDPKKTYLTYTKQVIKTEEALWALANNQYLSQMHWQTTQDLRHYSIGYVLGYEYGEPLGSYLKLPHSKKVEVQSVTQGLRKLHSGEIQLFVCNTDVLTFYTQQEGIPLKAFKRVGRPIIEDFGVFGISKKSRLSQDVQKINSRAPSP
ncbi:substrate-binding periplasmic protein [Bdellovibrio bacteriovorus]|uniref:substrate-binding periplasmic protein n=1 Tax=Bdellovibrio bacteriovorus TaxID=959 RepID=UPI0035A59C2F